MSSVFRRVGVVGGSGALGSAVLRTFRSAGVWQTISMDLHAAGDADVSLVVSQHEQLSSVAKRIEKDLEVTEGPAQFDALICTAGGWRGGNPGDDDFLDGAEALWSMCGKSTLLSAHIASKTVRPGGLIVFTGAQAAMNPTPGMVAYGMTKAATHHLISSMAENSKDGHTVVGILPNVLDTAANRDAMPDMDHSKWTPLDDVARTLLNWADGKNTPKTGTLHNV